FSMSSSTYKLLLFLVVPALTGIPVYLLHRKMKSVCAGFPPGKSLLVYFAVMIPVFSVYVVFSLFLTLKLLEFLA
ncbi:MAG TPA: hypothetical protein VIK74_03085, partial [Parasegetibacter sp.]